MDHGRTLSGLAPSTYQQVLADYFGSGYPLGAFMPLGLGGKLTGQDIAWLFQPTIAFSGAMLALSIYAVCARLISSRALRAFVAFLGAQPALLVSYALWSGIKELATAAMIALLCASLVTTIGRWTRPRATLPSALAAAALFAILSPAGVVWLLVPAAAVVTFLVSRGLRSSARVAIGLVAFVALLSIPSIAIARSFITGASGGEITTSTEVANLGHPLDTLQVFGIWPASDFRDQPGDAAAAYVLIGVLLVGIVAGLALAWRRRALGMPLYVAIGVGGVVIIVRTRASGPQLAVAECQGDGRGLAGPGRRRSSGRRGDLRDRTPRRGGADRGGDRGRRPVVEWPRVLQRVARAARAARGAGADRDPVRRPGADADDRRRSRTAYGTSCGTSTPKAPRSAGGG